MTTRRMNRTQPTRFFPLTSTEERSWSRRLIALWRQNNNCKITAPVESSGRNRGQTKNARPEARDRVTACVELSFRLTSLQYFDGLFQLLIGLRLRFCVVVGGVRRGDRIVIRQSAVVINVSDQHVRGHGCVLNG